MTEPIDLLKLKIEKAKEALPAKTRAAIDAVPWREVVYEMRTKKGLSITQLEDLELETELVLSGLVHPSAYPIELMNRLKISQGETDALVQELNERIFKKIRENLITEIHKEELKEKNKITTPTNPPITTPTPETPIAIEEKSKDSVLIRTILSQKLAGTHASPKVQTEYSLGNMSKKEWSDPYRANPTE